MNNIRISVHFLDEDDKNIINTLLIAHSPKLEYTEIIWSSHKKKSATKIVPELKGLTYEEELKERTSEVLIKKSNIQTDERLGRTRYKGITIERKNRDRIFKRTHEKSEKENA